MGISRSTAERALAAGFAVVRSAVEDGSIPGAALAVATREQVAIASAGVATLHPAPEPLSDDTWFDLASLTKAMVTTPAVLRLADAGRLSLDDPLRRLHPGVSANAPQGDLTVRDCLAHRTPLPAHVPLYLFGMPQAALKAHILNHPWPAGESVYSDLNFMLLGLVIEHLTGKPFAALPVAPGLGFSPDPVRCAATEHCVWRDRLLRGEVHDENAFALGGAAGHAGLFGTAEAVIAYGRSLLTGSGWDKSTLANMREPQGPKRTLGWELRHTGWPGGDRASPGSIGHTGFTGTGLWIDFERGVTWSLLTNRVHPSRHRETGIRELRRAAGDRILEAVAG